MSGTDHARLMLEVAQRYPALAKHTPSLLYAAGGVATLRLYAWWKDGTQYVGSCGTTLEAAEREWIEENTPTTEGQNDDRP